MRTEILEEFITKKHSGSKLWLCLVFTRSIKIVIACLAITFVLWLIWLQEYVWGFFLLGSALGILFFWILTYLKQQLHCQSDEDNLRLSKGAREQASTNGAESNTDLRE